VTTTLAAILHFVITLRSGALRALTAILHFSWFLEVVVTRDLGVKCQTRQAARVAPEASSELADLEQTASHRHCQNPDQILRMAIEVVVKTACQCDYYADAHHEHGKARRDPAHLQQWVLPMQEAYRNERQNCPDPHHPR
jgi:hypothetical protein